MKVCALRLYLGWQNAQNKNFDSNFKSLNESVTAEVSSSAYSVCNKYYDK